MSFDSEEAELMAELVGMALDQAGDAIIVIDRDGIVRAWSQMAERIFGFAAADALDRDVEFIIPERFRADHHEAFNRAMEAGHLASDGKARRTKGLTADGGTVYVEMTFAVINDPDGLALGSVAVAREVPAG